MDVVCFENEINVCIVTRYNYYEVVSKRNHFIYTVGIVKTKRQNNGFLVYLCFFFLLRKIITTLLVLNDLFILIFSVQQLPFG